MISRMLTYGAMAVIVAFGLSSGAMAFRPAEKASSAAAIQQKSYQEARGGCGSKGGPGYRKSNGKCAGWRG